MSVILLDNEIVHYEVLGRGRPVVFLHGWVGSWRYWIPTMQVTSGQFRSYAVDFWGFGDTAHSPERYTLDSQLELLEKFLDSMGIGKIAIVGHGLGSVVGLLFSQKHPELLDRLLAASLPIGAQGLSPRFRFGSPVELADWLLDENPDYEAVRVEVPKTDPLAVQESINGIDAIDLAELFQSTTKPRLLIYGAADAAVPSPTENDLLNLPPEAHQIQFQQSGHFPMVAERSQFTRLLMDFLALPAGENPQNLSLKEKWKRRVR